MSYKRTQKKTAMIAIGVFLAVFFFFLLSDPGFAQNNADVFGVAPVEDTIKLADTDIRIIIAKIIRAVLGLLGILTLGLMLYAGFIIMTSGGNEDKVAQGRKIMINATIGLVIIFSSFAIVQFILNALSDATGFRDGGRSSAPALPSFAGSGALGFIIADHYPFRDQTEVKRNSKIAITFREPIDPGSLILNSNNTCWGEDGAPHAGDECERDAEGRIARPLYGDCLTGVENFDYAVHCDRLNTSSIRIFPFATSSDLVIDAFRQRQDPGVQVVEAAALTTYEDGEEQNAYTFVFKPLQFLGDALQPVNYDVYLTNNITKKVGGGAFDDDRIIDDYYDWEFQTDTLLDLAPPSIVSVYPQDRREGYRNSVVKISFNEAVDPMNVQGLTGPATRFNNIIFGNQAVEGEWKISNGYTTVEFISNQACGQNSCGDTMYCVPVTCQDPNNVQCVTPYEVLVRTADLLRPGTGSFEAIPFSGVVDMADNALDGRSGDRLNGDGQAQGKPPVGQPKVIEEAERRSDNVWWNFGIRNDIDRTPPHIEVVVPFLDEEDIDGDAQVEMTFSRIMLSSGLTQGVRITEHPNALPFWQRVRSRDTDDEKTIGIVDHREFGPNDQDLYYFTSVSSSVKSVTQNCLYPGFGPLYPDVDANGQAPRCTVVVDANGAFQPNQHCVPVTADAATDTGCAQRSRQDAGTTRKDGIDTCLQTLRDLSPL